MKTLYFIRHGKASLEGSEAGRVLLPEGQAQAEQLADILENLSPPISRLFSSPFVRAQQTLEPIAGRLGLTIFVIDDLRERKMASGPVENLMEERKKMWADLSYKLEGGESGIECRERADGAIGEMLEAMDNETAAAVASHGNFIGLILNTNDPEFGFDQWRAMTMPDIFRIDFDDSGSRVTHIGCESVDTFQIGG